MRAIERIAIYVVVGCVGVAAWGTRGHVRADGPLDATFGSVTVRELRVGGPGGPVVTLGADAAGHGVVRIAYADGRPAVEVSVDAAGAGVAVTTPEGATCARLGTDAATGGGTVSVARKGGETAAVMDATSAGGRVRVHFSRTGRNAVLATDADASGTPVCV